MQTAKTDQTGWMPRLIRVFAWRTYHFVGFVMLWLSFIKAEIVVVLVFYGPSTHFRSFQVQSINLASLFLGKPPRQFTST